MSVFLHNTIQRLWKKIKIAKMYDEEKTSLTFIEWLLIIIGKLLLIGGISYFLYKFRYFILGEIIVIDSKIMYSLAFL